MYKLPLPSYDYRVPYHDAYYYYLFTVHHTDVLVVFTSTLYEAREGSLPFTIYP